MLARGDQREEALRLIGFCLGHPASGGETRTRAEQALKTLKTTKDDPAVVSASVAAANGDAFAFARRFLEATA